MKNFIYTLFILYFSFTSLIVSQNKSGKTEYNYQYDNFREKIEMITDKSLLNESDNVKSTIQVVANNLMDFLWVAGDNGEYYFSGTVRSYSYTFQLSDGTYHLFIRKPLVSEATLTFYYKDVVIQGDTIININFNECTKFKHLNLVREDNSHLNNSVRGFIIKHNTVPLGLIINQLPFFTTVILDDVTFYFNNLPSHPMTFEWGVVGNEYVNDGKYYFVSNVIENNRDTLITNNPEDFQHNIINFYFSSADIINANSAEIFWGGYHGYSRIISGLHYPIVLHAYINTGISPIMSFAKKAFEIHYGFNADSLQCFGNLSSLPLYFDQGKVYGYLKLFDNKKFVLTNKENFTLGMTPTYWYGKLNNSFDKISICGPWGMNGDELGNYTQLFLSQTNDALAHFPIKMKITNSADSVISDKFLYPFYISQHDEYIIGVGYSIQDMQENVTPGVYTVTFINDKDYLLDTLRCTVTAINKFDTRLSDKNPPHLNVFQIMGDSSFTHQLRSDQSNLVRFWAEDSTEIDTAKLFYSEYNSNQWEEITLQKDGEFYYGYIPELNSGKYSLKTYLVDINGNSLTMTQKPAFVYEKIVDVEDDGIIPSRFALLQNYPNPFSAKGGPTTNITYVIANPDGIGVKQSTGNPANANNSTVRLGRSRASLRSARNDAINVQLKVYDALGREVATLVNAKQAPGKYSVQFNASNLPSGVYFYTLRAGNFVQTRKMVLMK